MNQKLVMCAVIAMALTMAFCKAKKTVAAPAPDAFSKQFSVAEKRWTGVQPEELRQGHTIYTTKCTRCHGNFEITRFSESKWLHEIDEMAPKAKLTAEEKDKLTKHILSYREAFASAAAK